MIVKKNGGEDLNRIEIMGRLKERVNVNGKSFDCEDINLDSNFIIDLAMDLIQKLGYTPKDKRIQYEKFFDDEKVSRVKFEINYSDDDFGMVITRNTFGDKILVGCEISAKEDNTELFGSAYKLKVKVIDEYNRICDNSNIFFLEDYNNEKICQALYIEIYSIENKFRNILTRYLMKKYGLLVLSKKLKDEVSEYSKWFKKATGDKYKTFKRINTDYCNLDFANLPKILDLKDSQCVNQEGVSASTEVTKLRTLLEDEADINEILKQISKIQELISRRKNVFDDKASEEEKAAEIRDWRSSDILEREDLRDILDEDFRTLWENQLSKMRNMIAHNKPICTELYNDIIADCRIVDEKFDKCIKFIESNFYPDEEGVLSALEDMEYREEKLKFEDIERKREGVGIDLPLSEDAIETKIRENLESVQEFMIIVNKLGNMRNIIEEIDCVVEEFSSIDEERDNEEFRKLVFDMIKYELKLDEHFSTFRDIPVNEIINELLFSDIDIERAIEFYTDNEKYPVSTFKFECFSMDYSVEWYGIDNKEYGVTFEGTLTPENGGEDKLEFKFYVDKELARTYYICIDYGDYTVPSAGYINDKQVNYLVEDIKDTIEATVRAFKEIYDISMKLSKFI